MKYFNRLIQCQFCGKNYNYKNNNGTKQFICSTVKNYGRDKCPDSPYIYLDDLLAIIHRHCELNNKDWHISKAKLFILRIEVWEGIIIRWRDGLVSEVSEYKTVF